MSINSRAGMGRRSWACLMLVAAALAAAGCRVGPNYQPPTPPLAPSFTGSDTVAPATQQQAIAYSDWWKVFHDPELDTLEVQADTANRDVKMAIARVDEAIAAAGSARSYLFPTVSAQPQVARAREAQDRPNNGNTEGRAATYTDIQLPLVLNYEIDAFGRLRRTLEAARATAQASEADLRFVRLATEAAVAIDYYELREADQELSVVDGTVNDLQQALNLTELRFRNGLSSDLEVAEAKTLLDQTKASEQSLKIQREQLQHALAILLGRTPESLTLPSQPSNPEPPVVPVGLPSDLLQRRPDIAEADRNVAAATAGIGIAKAAYFPQLSLTGIAGYESNSPTSLLNWQNTIAGLAASAVAPIFTGGRLRAGVDQARAKYRESLAAYEKTVLVSYQEVEDQLSALHYLATQSQLQELALRDASRAEQIASDRYERGLVGYLDVVTAEQNVLFNERTATQISGQRLVASVVLIKALGGGWEQKNTP
jgi:outer membrane protein, multidrug efflux system